VRPIFHPVEQHSPEWHAIRRTGIGASEIAVLTGDAPWGDIRVTYQDKLGLAAPAMASRAMEVGTRLEDAIRQWYAEDEGVKVNRVRGIYRHPEIPFVIASLDGLTVKRPRRLVQIKVADSLGDTWGPERTDQIPDHYREQIEWEMLASGVEHATLVVFVVRARRLAIFEADRDERLSNTLIRIGADFWTCVETRTVPDVPAAAINRLIHLRADEVEADDEIVTLAAQHLMAQTDFDEAEDRLKRVKAQLKERLTDVGGARGVLPDGRAFALHHRQNKPGREVMWELLFNELRQRLIDAGTEPDELDDLIEEYTAITPGARPLRLNVMKEKKRVAA
jgi:putative phage-type endonuclease